MNKIDRFKFRIYDRENKKYLKNYYGYGSPRIEKFVLESECPFDDYTLFLGQIIKSNCTRFIIEQSSGFVDYNDNIIFEGDIVKATDGYFRKNIEGKCDIKTGKIKFYLGCFFIEWIEDSGKLPLYEFDCNILGNRKRLHELIITNTLSEDLVPLNSNLN